MKACRIKCILASISNESRGLGVVGRHQNSFRSVVNHHIRCFPAAQVVCTKCVARNDFAGNEEVVLPKGFGALPYVIGEFALRINRDLLPFVHAKAINVKHSNLNAGEMLDPFAYGWLPLS